MRKEYQTDLSKVTAEFAKSIQATLQPLQEASAAISESFRESNAALQQPLQQISARMWEIQEGFKARLKPVFEVLQKRLSQLDCDLDKLAKFNWLPDLSEWYFLPDELVEAIDKDDSQVIDRILIAHFKSKESLYFNRLCESHPDRNHLLQEIQMLAEAKYYHGAISLIFSQIDGICFDLTRELMFRSDRDRGFQPKMISALENCGNHLADSFWSLLKQKSPSSISNEKKTSSELNRHKIIHGTALNYGNELNYYQTFSLLCFVHEMLVVTKINGKLLPTDSPENKIAVLN